MDVNKTHKLIKWPSPDRQVVIINVLRAWSLFVAESIDAWRLTPRLILTSYGWIVYKVIDWYMHIPLIYAETSCKLVDAHRVCDITNILTPTTQQAALVTAIIGAGTVVVGFYVNSGRDWNRPMLKWFTSPPTTTPTPTPTPTEDIPPTV